MIRRGVEKGMGQRFSGYEWLETNRLLMYTHSTKCKHKIPVKQWSTFGCCGDIFSLARTQSALGALSSPPYSQFHGGFNRFMQIAQINLWPRSYSTARHICSGLSR